MNTTGNKYGGRTKGTPNKLTSKIKELIKERNLSISENKIKRISINYNYKTGQTEKTFRYLN